MTHTLRDLITESDDSDFSPHLVTREKILWAEGLLSKVARHPKNTRAVYEHDLNRTMWAGNPDPGDRKFARTYERGVRKIAAAATCWRRNDRDKHGRIVGPHV